MYTFYFQPNGWAQLLCSGHVGAIDLGTDVGRYCQHVLVVAGTDRQVCNPSVTGEWSLLIDLAQSLGAVPYEFSKEVVGKVVGTLEVARAPQLANTTPWTYGNDDPNTVYRIINASLLTEPCSLDTLRGYYLTERSYQPLRPKHVFPHTLFLPVSEYRFYNCYEGNTLTLPLVGCLREMLLVKGRLLKYKYITVVNANRERTFKVELEDKIFTPCDGVGDPVTVYSKFRKEHIKMEFVIFHLGTKI